MKFTRHLVTLMTCILFWAPSFGQSEVEMADTMRSEGKIYVVVAILLIILGGLVTYLFLMDRKISRLEKKAEEKKS
jgi:CcmD family protein